MDIMNRNKAVTSSSSHTGRTEEADVSDAGAGAETNIRSELVFPCP